MAMSRPATTPAAVACAGARDGVAERNAFGLRERKSLCGGVRRHDARAELRGTAGRRREICKLREIDLAALGVQIGQALRQLGHLGDAAGDGDARHRMAAQIFQHAADEVAHVDQRDLRQIVELLRARLGTRRRSRRRYG